MYSGRKTTDLIFSRSDNNEFWKVQRMEQAEQTAYLIISVCINTPQYSKHAIKLGDSEIGNPIRGGRMNEGARAAICARDRAEK